MVLGLSTSSDNALKWYWSTSLKPPSHSDKDHKDRTTFLKRDKHRENGTKCRKKHSFQVCSTSLLRSCQDVTASNTSQQRFVPRLITHSPRSLRF